MKKILCSIFSILVFTAFSLNVKADSFDVQSCKINCRNSGSQYNICMAGCDAQENIEKQKEGCMGNTICIDRWENSLASKTQFYLECYEGSTGAINYCTHDSTSCYNSCGIMGDTRDCRADCAAKDQVIKCIYSAYDAQGIQNCKNNYNYYRDKEYQGNVSPKPEEEFNYETCKNKCTDSNMKECESACYAQNMVNQCLSTCRDLNCERGCKNSYNGYYENRLHTYSPYSKVQCGDVDVPYLVPQIVRTIILVLQIATPIIIVVLGSLDLAKAVIAHKEDEIRKGQQTFIRRLILGSLVFLVFVVVELIVGLVAPKNEEINMWNCVDCFINGDCKFK